MDIAKAKRLISVLTGIPELVMSDVHPEVVGLAIQRFIYLSRLSLNLGSFVGQRIADGPCGDALEAHRKEIY